MKGLIDAKKAKERCLSILSKGGQVKREKLNLPSQSTWDSFERGYMKAIEDVNLKMYSK